MPIRSDYAVNDVAQHLPTVIPAQAGIQQGGVDASAFTFVSSDIERVELAEDLCYYQLVKSTGCHNYA